MFLEYLKHNLLYKVTLFFLIILLLVSCQPPVEEENGVDGSNNSGSGSNNSNSELTNIWTWISGSNTRNQTGVYGTKGTPDSSNIPGARDSSINWIDSFDNLWLFGGYGYDSNGTDKELNDLWKFDGTNWTWVSGSNTVSQNGIYGIKGTPNSSNIPGARQNSISWIDSSGNLWLFGGYGYDSSKNHRGCLNDLWKFDGANWTWISGSDGMLQTGVYNTKGTSNSSNIPGARRYSISWIDSYGNLWLFGGYGLDSTGNIGYLNDLWKFDGANWTWVSGSNNVNQSGTYGTKGSTDASNIPGARDSSISWIDSSGNLWLFGGTGYDSTGSSGYLNDLWKFDGANWTWVSGSNNVNQSGTYGTKGSTDASNIPGARRYSISWIDSSGNLWLFGGQGYDSTNTGYLNDLWKFDGINWTWVSGRNTRNQTGVYGTKGTADPANMPGARYYSISWIDSSGNMWLFGGNGLDSTGTNGYLNDLWRYQP